MPFKGGLLAAVLFDFFLVSRRLCTGLYTARLGAAEENQKSLAASDHGVGATFTACARYEKTPAGGRGFRGGVGRLTAAEEEIRDAGAAHERLFLFVMTDIDRRGGNPRQAAGGVGRSGVAAATDDIVEDAGALRHRMGASFAENVGH